MVRPTLPMKVALCLAVCLLIASVPIFATDWPTISQEELTMKDNPASPGSLAMILDREEVANATDASETFYYRVKIFTEEGKKYADIEIPYVKGPMQIRDVQARTVHPDGTSINFDGQTFDKLVMKAGEVRVLERTFTLPDVTPGSVIEYRYRMQKDPDYVWNVYWDVQGNLYTKHAHFIFKPYAGGMILDSGLAWRAFRLPKEMQPQKQKDGTWAMDANNIQGLPEEEYMPPEEELRGRIEWIYLKDEPTKEPKEYWDKVAKRWAEEQDHFVGKRAAIKQAADQAVSPNDSTEIKLRKLYARAVQTKNLNAAEEKTAKEQKRDKTKDNQNSEDVLKRGYGTGNDINYFFVALAQAEGFDASVVWASPRNHALFHMNLENSSELDDQFVMVRTAEKDYFLDPSASQCPFDLLPWYETGIDVLRPTKQGAVFVKTPLIPGVNSRTERIAKFTLGQDGMLSGSMTLRYTGERALARRENERNEDDTAKRKAMTEEVKQWLGTNTRIELTDLSGWDKPDDPIEAQFKITMPANLEAAGRRALFPLGVYNAGRPQMFEHAARQQQVYFHFPYSDSDDITIQMPLAWSIESVPTTQTISPGGGMQYQITAKQDAGVLHIQRQLTVGGVLYSVENYPALRKFFSLVKTDDEQQAVITVGVPSAPHN
jgi:Domain of Unknown Function with PDB structure (DUF3857)